MTAPTRRDDVNDTTTARDRLAGVLHAALYGPNCHNGHVFTAGICEGGSLDPRWCDTCGEARHRGAADAILASPALDAIVAERVAALANDEAVMRRWHALSNPNEPTDPTWDWTRASAKARALAAALTDRGADA